MKQNLKKTKLLLLAGFFLFVAGACFAQTSPAPFDPPIIKAFADSLYEEGFLAQAEGEYKRYLFSIDDITALSTIQQQEFQSSLLSLCNIYKKQNNKDGINWLKNAFFEPALPEVKEKINLLQGQFIFKERNTDSFSRFASSDSMEKQSALFTPDFVNLVKASDLLLKKDISTLSDLCSTLVPQFINFEKLAELSSSYKTKSPGFALFLSTIIPGSGKWYTGSFGSFVSSFLAIGTFAAGTVVTGIQTEWKSWQPYVFGACGLVLYIAEIYGAYQSAKRYNDSLFRIMCEETDRLYDVIY